MISFMWGELSESGKLIQPIFILKKMHLIYTYSLFLVPLE